MRGRDCISANAVCLLCRFQRLRTENKLLRQRVDNLEKVQSPRIAVNVLYLHVHVCTCTCTHARSKNTATLGRNIFLRSMLLVFSFLDIIYLLLM